MLWDIGISISPRTRTPLDQPFALQLGGCSGQSELNGRCKHNDMLARVTTREGLPFAKLEPRGRVLSLGFSSGLVYLYPLRTPLSPSYHPCTNTIGPYSSHFFFFVSAQYFTRVTLCLGTKNRERRGKREKTANGQLGGGRKRSLSAVSGGVSGCDLPPFMLLPTKPQRLAALAMPVLSPMTPSSARSSRRLTNGR